MNSISKTSLLRILEGEIQHYISCKRECKHKLARNVLNTKIKCTHVYTLVDTKGFKSGEIYEVKNGRVILPNGSKSHTVFESIEQVNESFYAYFKEIKEEE